MPLHHNHRRASNHTDEDLDDEERVEDLLEEEIAGHAIAKTQLQSYMKVAIISVEFDEPMYVQEATSRCALGKCGQNATLGLTRLQCGVRLFESHPRRLMRVQSLESVNGGHTEDVSPDETPFHLIPWSELDMLPVVRLFEPWLRPHDERRYTAVLLLAHSHRSPEGKEEFAVNLEESELSKCKLHFLPETSQNWKPTGALVNDAGASFHGTVPLSIRADEQEEHEQCVTPSFPKTVLQTEEVQSRVAQHVTQVILEHLDMVEQQREYQQTQLVETEAQARLVGVISGPLMGIMKPVADPMGSIVGAVLGDIVVTPIAGLIVNNLAETLTSALQPGLVNEVIDNITPTLTETCTDTIIETLSFFVSDFVSEKLTPKVTKDLTALLKKTLVPLVATEMATEGVADMVRKVTASITHILGRSVPHALVSSMSYSMAHSPLIDFYCYYCYKHQEYCEFCKHGVTPGQVYYSMFYCGWYSTYYSLYFGEPKDMGVKVVRAKELNVEDPQSFGAEE